MILNIFLTVFVGLGTLVFLAALFLIIGFFSEYIFERKSRRVIVELIAGLFLCFVIGSFIRAWIGF